ncbi:thiamine biosynthesis lipoprotein [Thiothrix caldifontis]|uniref:FAD:protein FMN transferase n=2 Tax=Thiothrix caldifontis TaxID=525918 RepID=A0A1H3VFB8_9GAMM|nr:thiamine biosynthesis lipoprotein [Thiothrix caldifontis]
MTALPVHPVIKPNLLKALCLWLLLSLLSACEQRSAAWHIEGMQGTALWHVTLTAPPPDLNEAALKDGLAKTFSKTNQLLATWDQTSVLSQFNRYQGTDWFPVEPALAQLVDLTLKISKQSEGAYDVTVGPLIRLWGFGSHESEKAQIPTQTDIDTALARVGYQKLQVRFDPPSIRKSQADVQVELASVADGFAADQAGLYLESLGIRDYMVEIAGEVRARGLSPRGDAWRIAIEKPQEEGRAIQQGISLQDAGLATSGDYRNFFVKEGKRYSHTVNPVSGAPVTHNLASVSVLADDATQADAYATLLMALGEEKGKTFADNYNIHAYFIWRVHDGFKVYATKGMQSLLKK